MDYNQKSNNEKHETQFKTANKRIIPLTDEINHVVSELKKETLSLNGDDIIQSIKKVVNKELQNSLQLISKELSEQTHLAKAFDKLITQNVTPRSKTLASRSSKESVVNCDIANEQILNYFSTLDDRIKQVDENITNIVSVLKTNISTPDKTETSN